MIDELRQRGHRVDVMREGRQARGAELFCRGLERRGDRERLAGLRDVLRAIAHEPRHVIAEARSRQAHEDGIGRIALRKHRQDVAEHAAVGQERGSQVDRIARGPELRQLGAQLGPRGLIELREREAMLLGRIRRHDARSARVADRNQPAAFGFPSFQVQVGGIHEAADVGHAIDAVLAEEGVDHAVFGGQRARVRACRRRASGRDARLERDDRQPAFARNLRRTRKPGRVRDGLEIEQQQLHFRVEGDGQREVGDGEVAFVAGGVRMAHADALPAQERIRHHAHRAGLAHDADRPVHGFDLAEDGREGRNGPVREVGDALGVRPDDAHARRASGAHHVLLRLLPGLAGFAETRGDDHRDFHPAPGARRDRVHRAHAGHGHDGEIRRFRNRSDVRIGLEALDHGAIRVDRVDPPLVAGAQHVLDRPAADLLRVLGGADDRNRLRVERGGEAIVFDGRRIHRIRPVGEINPPLSSCGCN